MIPAILPGLKAFISDECSSNKWQAWPGRLYNLARITSIRQRWWSWQQHWCITLRPWCGGGGGAGLRGGSVVKDGSSIKTQIVDRGASFLLKTELIPGSHRMSNSSVMRVNLIRTLGELVRQECDFLTISRRRLVTITSLSIANSCSIPYGYTENLWFSSQFAYYLAI